MKRAWNIGYKTFITISLVITVLLAALYFALQWAEVQSAMAQKATKWLSEKLGTTVSVGKVNITWFDEATLEDVVLKDLENRDMIYVREIYLNTKSNFTLNRKNLVRFDNNIDYVLLKEPFVKIIREDNGELNIDRWISKINKLFAAPRKDTVENNVPFTIDEAIVENGSFELLDPNAPSFDPKLFDYYNFRVDEIHGNLKNFFIQGDTILFKAANVKGINQQSDLVIKKINTDFFYCRTQMLFNNLSAFINESHLRDFLGFYFNKPSDFNKFNDKVILKAKLKNSKLYSQDLGRFSTSMYAYKDYYTLSSELHGTVRDLHLKNTNLRFGENSFLVGNMAFQGLPYIEKTYYDFDLTTSRITQKDARQYAGEKNYAKYVKKFGVVDFEGLFQGKYDDFYTKASFVSSTMGTLAGKLDFMLDPKSRKPEYTGEVENSDLNLALLTDNANLLQNIRFKGQINGEGSTLGDAALRLNGSVEHVYFNGYNFSNITANGLLVNSKFDGFIKVQDQNLKTQITGLIDFNKNQNEFHIIGILESLNLKALGYTDGDYNLQTNFNLDFEGNEIDNFIGSAKFNNFYLRGPDRNLVLDFMRFTSRNEEDKRVLAMQSEFLDGRISGSFVPSTLINDLSTLIKEYALFFNGTEESRLAYYQNKKETDSLRTYQADYQLQFKDSRNFMAFFSPEVYISPKSALSGRIKIQNTSLFTSYGHFDTLSWKGNNAYNTDIDFYSSKKAFAPEVLTSIVALGESQQFSNNLQTESFEFNGSWGNSKEIQFDSFIKQKGSTNRAQVFGKLNFTSQGYVLKVNSRNSKLHLLDKDWLFDRDNSITYANEIFVLENVEIRNGTQRLAANGKIANNSEDLLDVSLENFDLAILEPLLAFNIDGIANGDARLRDLIKNTVVESNLSVKNLAYEEILLGDLETVVSWDEEKRKVIVDGSVERNSEIVFGINGTYDPVGDIDLVAQMKNTDIEVLGIFVDGILDEIGGKADGKLEIKGSPLDPIIKGNVQVNDGKLRIVATGTRLYFSDNIVFNEEGFIADRDGITVFDAPRNGNSAVIKGGIFNGGAGNYMLGMHANITSRNGFKLMSLSEKESEFFFGTAYGSGDLHLTGSFENVLVSGNLTSRQNSKVTIPLDAATSVDVTTEAIPFVNRNKKEEVNKEEDREKVAKKAERPSTGGVRISMNLRLTPDAECEILFDRKNNDKLNAFGNGRLSIEYDTRGLFTMNGPYVVTRGIYDFSFQNLASLRKFEILDGSRITWSGDPYNASLDVKAAYATTFALGDVPGIAIEDGSEGNSRFPMSVVIDLTGPLETPNIGYNLEFDQTQMPIRYQAQILAFQQRMRNDEQVLSRNVSSILALNQFFPETGGADVFNQQFLIDNLSNMLSNQIGNLANKLDPNLELGVLVGDFRQNLMNNLQFNFSYRLLNNRVKLSGKSSFSNTIGFLENTNTNFTNTQGFLTLGGEVEWLLSEDGTWKLKGYSRSVPNMTLISTAATGNVVVSGVNIIFSRNFNSLFPKKVSAKPASFPLGVGKKEDQPELSFQNKEKG